MLHEYVEEWCSIKLHICTLLIYLCCSIFSVNIHTVSYIVDPVFFILRTGHHFENILSMLWSTVFVPFKEMWTSWIEDQICDLHIHVCGWVSFIPFYCSKFCVFCLCYWFILTQKIYKIKICIFWFLITSNRWSLKTGIGNSAGDLVNKSKISLYI